MWQVKNFVAGRKEPSAWKGTHGFLQVMEREDYAATHAALWWHISVGSQRSMTDYIDFGWQRRHLADEDG
jgi:hypothetical protein